MHAWPAAVALLLITSGLACTGSRPAKTPAQGPMTEPRADATPAEAAERSDVTGTNAGDTLTDFDRTVRPILEKQCRPCHFEDGIMHAKLPFDRAETILTLGERLFTRIKDPQDQESIRAFLRGR